MTYHRLSVMLTAATTGFLVCTNVRAQLGTEEEPPPVGLWKGIGTTPGLLVPVDYEIVAERERSFSGPLLFGDVELETQGAIAHTGRMNIVADSELGKVILHTQYADVGGGAAIQIGGFHTTVKKADRMEGPLVLLRPFALDPDVTIPPISGSYSSGEGGPILRVESPGDGTFVGMLSIAFGDDLIEAVLEGTLNAEPEHALVAMGMDPDGNILILGGNFIPAALGGDDDVGSPPMPAMIEGSLSIGHVNPKNLKYIEQDKLAFVVEQEVPGLDALASGKSLVLHVAAAQSLPEELAPGEEELTMQTIGELLEGNTNGAVQSWDELVRHLVERGADLNVTHLLYYVVNQGVLEQSQELSFWAERIVELDRLIEDADGMEEQELREERELANVELEGTLQEQQQTLELLASLSKLMHDTAVALLRSF